LEKLGQNHKTVAEEGKELRQNWDLATFMAINTVISQMENRCNLSSIEIYGFDP
jgi:hypothetical protein